MGKLLNSLRMYENTVIDMVPTSPMYGVLHSDGSKTKTLIDTLTCVMSKEIKFYKETVFPIIKDYSISIENTIAVKSNDVSYIPDIDVFELTPFVHRIMETHKPLTGFTLRDVKLSLPNTVDWEDMLTKLGEGSKLTNDVKEFLMSCKHKDIEEAYKLFIKPCVLRGTYESSRYKHLEIGMALAYILNKLDPLDGSGVLADYKYYVEMIYMTLRDTVVKLATKAVASEKSGYIVLGTTHNRVKGRVYSILVSSKHLNAYYANGGVIEAIYGSVIGYKSYITLNDMLNEGQTYVDAWSSKVSTYEASKSILVRDIARRVYTDKLYRVYEYLNISDMMIETKSTISMVDDVAKYLKGIPSLDLLAVNETVANFILDVVLKDTNARLFTERFKVYDNELNNKTVSAKMAVTDLLVKYLMTGINVVKIR